jgi:phage terminase large subunit
LRPWRKILTAEASRELAERQGKKRTRWKTDPVGYAQEVLGLRCWDLQSAVLEALVTNHRVACRSGHKVGKSVMMAAAALWWADTHEEASVVMTAPTDRQVRRILWKEVRRLVRQARVPFPTVAKDPGTGIQWEDGRFVVGFSTNEAENMGGFSGPAMLFLVDEASGVEEQIFEAIEGNTAGGDEEGSVAVAKILMTGNPTRTSGTFFQAFNGRRSQWDCHHIASTDSPNARAGAVVIPGLATQYYCQEKAKSWGIDSDLYRVRVAGEFPRQGGNAVVALALVESAVARHELGNRRDDGPLEIGVDVARFGDDQSCIVARRGHTVVAVEMFSKLDEVDVTGKVLECVSRLRYPGEAPPAVKVDVTGVGGGVASLLARDERVRVVECPFGAGADEPDEHTNLRSELWFGVAQWLAAGGTLPDDDDLLQELVTPTYGFDARGRRIVEPKDKIKQRVGRSPDRADALALAVYSPGWLHTESTNSNQEDAPGLRLGTGRGFG